MKTVAVLALVAVLLLPGIALAGPSTDAALGLGAFAVFNQIISGTGIFAGRPAIVAPQPVVVAPPAPVYAYPAPPRGFRRADGHGNHGWNWKHDRNGHHDR